MSSGARMGSMGLYPTWDGMLFLTDGAFSPMHAGRGAENEYNEYRQRIHDTILSLDDARVRWIDGLGLSKEDRFSVEDGPDHITRSQHFHSHCDNLHEDENGQVKTMKI
jgi:hypothetical protein